MCDSLLSNLEVMSSFYTVYIVIWAKRGDEKTEREGGCAKDGRRKRSRILGSNGYWGCDRLPVEREGEGREN